MTTRRGMPAAEVVVDVPLVRGLLADQYPDLTDLPLVEVAHGWDNVIYRLGDALAVRLPRRELAARLVEHEQRWLPVLAPALPLAVPAPVRLGRRGRGYPWSWSICPWLPGEVAARVAPVDPADAAERLGRFFAALHVPAPAGAPANPYRGVALAERDAITREHVEAIGDAIDGRGVLDAWERAVAAPRWQGPPLWLHGDPHPANVLVHDGRVSAVIDFGDLTAGDPATDLALAWTLVPPHARPLFRRAAGDCDDATWTRARGWALALGVACLASSADDALMTSIGTRTLDAVLADADGRY